MAGQEWQELRAHVRGELVLRGEPHYEAARRALSWNARMPNALPAALLRVAGEDDVAFAVRFARETGRRIAVRSGGHSWCGAPFRDESLLLDLGALREIAIDPGERVATVGPALTNGALCDALLPHGLAFPVGHCPSVALGGYLLSGGFGWNSGSFGPACARVRAIDVIDARGDRRRIDAQHDPDYFWAARGAGAGFFGVATRFELELAPLPRVIRALALSWPRDAAAQVSELLPALLATRRAALELTLFAFPASSPRALELLAVAFASSAAEAEELLRPLAPLARSAASAMGPQSRTFPALLAGLGAFYPEQRRHGVDVLYSDRPSDELWPELAEAIALAPSPHSLGMIVPAPPVDASAPQMEMALSLFAPTFVGLYGQWERAAEDEPNLAWLRAERERFRGSTCGHYVGETDLLADADRARRCFAPAAFERLCALRARYDPDGVFAGFPLGASSAT